MRIRRKLPKPRKPFPPLFVVGYSALPRPDAVKAWFDLEYGGPLSFNSATSIRDRTLATHGPWSVPISWSVSKDEAEGWREQLQWTHRSCATVNRPSYSAQMAADTILHATRLARGLTLLTEGTAYDTELDRYWNPSDWSDSRLVHFDIRDHVRVMQTDAPEQEREWWLTRGLHKFGLDEIELFRPIGLPDRGVESDLLAVADELIRLGRSPNVGMTVPIPALDRTIRVVRHRTIAMPPAAVILREITW